MSVKIDNNKITNTLDIKMENNACMDLDLKSSHRDSDFSRAIETCPVFKMRATQCNNFQIKFQRLRLIRRHARLTELQD